MHMIEPMTQSELAARLDISKRTLQRYQSMPYPPRMFLLALRGLRAELIIERRQAGAAALRRVLLGDG